MHKFDYTVSAQFRTSAWLYSCKLCMLWNDPGDTTLAKGSKDSMVLQSNFGPHQFKIILYKTDHEMGDLIDTKTACRNKGGNDPLHEIKLQ